MRALALIRTVRRKIPGLLGLVWLSIPVAHADADSQAIGRLKQLNVEDLLAIEVTSVTHHASPLLTAAAAIQVITQAEIRRSGATTLPEALRLADNLQVAQRGARGWAISARGFNTDLANKLLVMIDGRTVYTPLYSGVFWEAQDYLLEDIDRIEVISGPGGTLWGANAVNGVINIITKSAAQTQGLHAEAAAGSELNSMGGLRYGGSLSPQVQYRLYGKFLELQDSVLADGTDTDDSWRRRQAGFRIDGQSGQADAWQLQGDYYANHEQVPAGGQTVMRGANLLGRWARTLGADGTVALRIYYDWTHLSSPVAPLAIGALTLSPAGRLQDDLQTLDVDFHHRFAIGPAQLFTWGVGFRNTHDVVGNAPALTFLPAVLDQQLYSAFVQDEIRLRENVSLTIGSKIEHNDYTGFEYEPSARLQWQPTTTRTVWAAVSRAIRAPSRIDRDLYQGAPPYLTILKGGPEFESENVLAYELGYRAVVGSAFTLGLSTFYNEYTDLRSTTITPPLLLPFYFENGIDGHSYGMEFTGGLQLAENWSLHAGYNLVKTKLRVATGRIDISNGRNETADPQNQVSLRSALELPRGVEVDAGLRWVDTLHNSNGPARGNVPAYLELDARLAWHVSEQIELALVGRNLLDDHHPEYGFPSAARAEVERSVYGKVVWRR